MPKGSSRKSSRTAGGRATTASSAAAPTPFPAAIDKAPTDIPGFDEITRGGLPRGRTTLVVGGPGTGKTVFALEMLVNGARDHGEPAIFVAFEENSRQIVDNASTFGWDLPALERDRVFFLDAHLSPGAVQAGDFDIGGLLAVLEAKVEEMGARRIVFDGIDILLALLDDAAAERRELYRLHEWLQGRDLTGIITAKIAEHDHPSAERYAFMQFMVDCVVLVQHRMVERVSLRSLRVLKYRGSGFAEGEFPLVISGSGIEVSTFGAADLRHEVSTERVPTGVERLDAMLGGGYYRGSSILISGAPGTAKTTLAAAFVDAGCRRGERALVVSFDESAAQIVRNLRSVGIDLGAHMDAGLLDIHAIRTEAKSAEEHLLEIRSRVVRDEPRHLVLDPISALAKTGGLIAATHASLRVVDLAKSLGVTIVCTSLVASEALEEATSTQISTIADTWMHLSYVIHGGERNRALTIVKSRGMRHSNQVRELVLGEDGVTLADVYSAGGEVLVGTARFEREAELREEERRRAADAERRRTVLAYTDAEIDARIAALERERAAAHAEFEMKGSEDATRREQRHEDRSEVRRLRGGEAGARISGNGGGDGGARRSREGR